MHYFLISCSQRILCNQCRIQHELEVTTKQAIFVDSSISDTIRTCIVLGNHRAANKVKTEFKVCQIRIFLPQKVDHLIKEDKFTHELSFSCIDVHMRPVFSTVDFLI